LAFLEIEERVKFNEKQEAARQAFSEYSPMIIMLSFVGSLVYTIATKPTMKSVIFPTLKGTLLGSLAAFSFYRFKKMDLDNEMEISFSKIVRRKYNL
jgi:hypothetical protein